MPRGIYKRKPFTSEHRDAISRANRGDKHPRWIPNPTADQRKTLVRRIVQKYSRACMCEDPNCEKKSTKFMWVSISGLYKYDYSDWMMSCKPCAQCRHPLEDRVAELYGEPNVCERCGCKSGERYYRWLNKYRVGCDFFDRSNWQQLCAGCYPAQKENDRRNRMFRSLNEM